MKVPVMLGTLGGVVQILRIIFTYFCIIFSKTRRDLKCINSIFYFEKYNSINNLQNNNCIESPNKNFIDSSKIFNGKKQIQLKVLDFKNTHFWDYEEKSSRANLYDEAYNDNNSNLSHNNTKIEENKKKKIKEHLLKLNKKHQNSLILNGVETIEALLCNRCVKSKKMNYKKLLFEKSSSLIHHYLDIIFMIKKLNEFEILKKMIINQEQANIFELIEKQLITVDEKNSNEKLKYESITKKIEYSVECITNLQRRIISSPNMVSEVDKALNEILVKVLI
jgi:hypothetical protein